MNAIEPTTAIVSNGERSRLPVRNGSESGATPDRTRPAGQPWHSWAAAPLTALLLGSVVAVVGARGSDWPAHLFRIELFRDVGLTLWNGQWYGGHYTLGYSVVFPPLASWFGPLTVGIASSIVASGALAALLQRYFGTAGAVAACWFAVGTAVNLAVGRLPFALGLAFGLVALLAYERRWWALGLDRRAADLAGEPRGWCVPGDRARRHRDRSLAPSSGG